MVGRASAVTEAWSWPRVSARVKRAWTVPKGWVAGRPRASTAPGTAGRTRGRVSTWSPVMEVAPTPAVTRSRSFMVSLMRSGSTSGAAPSQARARRSGTTRRRTAWMADPPGVESQWVSRWMSRS